LSTADRTEAGTLRYGVCGLLTIGLVAPPPQAFAELDSLFGSSRDPASAADLRIRFVDSITPRGELRLLDLNKAAFDAESFYVLDSFGKRARLDLDRIGDGIEIVCERDARAIPLLLPVVGLHLLRKGHVLLHSASFLHGGQGVLATGWKKGGKTELLLAYMSNGAQYLSDEWSIVSADGTIRGVPGIARIWDWHLAYAPELRRRVALRARGRMKALSLYRRLYAAFERGQGGGGVLRERLDRLALKGGVPSIGQVAAWPESLFPDRVSMASASLDIVFQVTVSEDGTSVVPTTGEAVAQRMVASQEYERRQLRTAYEQFRFAFPQRRSSLLETAPDEERHILTRAFAGRPAFELRHRYPVPLPELYRVTHDLVESAGMTPRSLLSS